MTKKIISIGEAKKRLSELVGRVASGGEDFVIARRGKAMARLLPLGTKGLRLADVKGWLPNDDPFFAEIDAIVSARGHHRPRNARRPGLP